MFTVPWFWSSPLRVYKTIVDVVRAVSAPREGDPGAAAMTSGASAIVVGLVALALLVAALLLVVFTPANVDEPNAIERFSAWLIRTVMVVGAKRKAGGARRAARGRR